MSLEIVKSGPLTTIQDGGRTGYAKLGYRRCGACDRYAMELANILAGNWEDSCQAVLEFTMRGGTIRFGSGVVIALTGADMEPKLDGTAVAMYQPVIVRPGQVLKLGFAKTGLRTYLAVGGGLLLPEVMGSCSTDSTCGIGGLEGRALKDGDLIKLRISGNHELSGSGVTRADRKVAHEAARYREDIFGREKEFGIPDDWFWLRQPSYPYRSAGKELVPVMRVVPGPQEEAFTEKGRETLWRSVYRVAADSNRMACRLEGAELERVDGSDMISDGIVEGSIQVAANGLPMVMLSDHQTTGGYAKIGTVIHLDLAAIAQRKPGESIGFTYITPEQANEAYRKEVEKLEWLKRELVTKRKARQR